MEAILKENERTEQTECDTMQSVDTDNNRSAKELELTGVETKVKYVFMYYVITQTERTKCYVTVPHILICIFLYT